MGLGRVQLRKMSPYIIELQGFTAKQPEPHPCQLVRNIGMLRVAGDSGRGGNRTARKDRGALMRGGGRRNAGIAGIDAA